MRIVITLMFIVLVNLLRGQTIMRVILDKQSETPIPYTTIKVLHTNKGTIATGTGQFGLNIDSADSVLFSCVGYQQRVLVGSDIKPEIYLERKIQTLSEVKVNSNSIFKKLILGNTAKLKVDANWGPSPGDSRDELAQKIYLPDSLLSYRIRLLQIPVEKYICWGGTLLLTIYAEDTVSHLPGEEIYLKAVQVDKKNLQHGKLGVDLSTENLIVSDVKSFFVGIKWLPDAVDQRCLTVVCLSKSSKEKTFTRTLHSPNYNWFSFGHIKLLNGEECHVSTFFSVEVDQLK